MSADSPTEYVEELREQNKTLRANVVQLVREKQKLMEEIAYLSSVILHMRASSGRRPHDYEPARPGIDTD